ncbi:hypothetical protein M0R45_022488 [Rubus argutus]|uniref:Protein kinase domain-containing protein n=1 Tax=Rubus argutus TaxID=59490 RepID=A0AAW1XHW6_RUBAR
MGLRFPLLFLLLSLWPPVQSQSGGGPDRDAMEALLRSFKPRPPDGWSPGSDYCKWGTKTNVVQCDKGGKVTWIIIKELNLGGSLPPDVRNLTSLLRLEVQFNQLTGPFPNLKGMSSLQTLYASNNNFTSFPADDFFSGLTSLTDFRIDGNPSLEAWQIPETVKDASGLTSFRASKASIFGKIPDYFNSTYMSSLTDLELGSNDLQGELPRSFSGSGIRILRLDNNNLNGTLDVLQSMTELNEVHLNMNQFTGPLPDFSNYTNLTYFYVSENQITGIVPSSLVNKSPKNVSLGNNYLQGPTPKFKDETWVDTHGTNSFCLDKEGVDCDPRVNILLSIAKDMGYPATFAKDWKGNDPCGGWKGLTCSTSGGNITVINFAKMGLPGTISPNFSLLTSLTDLRLNDNLLTGTIPKELTDLPNLRNVDFSNNKLYGKVPAFKSNVVVKLAGNPDIGKDHPSVPAPGTPTGPNSGGNKKSKTGVIVGVVLGCVVGLVLVGFLFFCLLKRKQRRTGKVPSPNSLVVHPRHSGDQNAVKISVANRFNSSGNGSYDSPTNNGPNDIHVEAGNMIISIQVLRSVTNNFNEDKVLGKGGFGSVYEGELHDGTKIAVKRMESGVVAEKGLHEFKSEIAVLTKVRHRHLVGLLGYCLDGNERLLVYEHMPQGTLSRHLFHWKEEGLEPLEWTRRLTIALDVARGVEYLHGLANEIFIHRDLKPSNILLGDDMRAKVADFGLVRLAPAGKASIETRLAGTFGYLAPEYAATGRMTLKVDVYSFGVILMELITGRKAIDESQPEESCHLVTWFRRKLVKTDGLPEIVDPTIDVNEETLSSISTVAELAGHCSAREPYQRPDMGHAVNVLSSLVEQWKPSKQEDFDEMDAINFDVPLNEAVKMWQAAEGKSNIDESSSSSIFPSGDTTQTSIPNRPSGFAESFTSTDGR